MEMETLLHWCAPPIVGAFIGYFTNKVAIKMLFRPLKPWRVFGVRVPMTPGVIPSKRGQLADNMGEVVGEHLLTSDELGTALTTDAFRRRMQELIQGRLSGFLERDLGPLPQVLPQQLQMFFTLGLMGLSGRLKGMLSDFLRGEAVQKQLEEAVRQRLHKALESDSSAVVTPQLRGELQRAAESGLAQLFAADEFSALVEEFLQRQVGELRSSDASLGELLPRNSLNTLVETVVQSLADLSGSTALMLRDETLLEQVVGGIMGGVEKFIDSLGSASEVVRGFVKMEVVEYQVRRLLQEREGDITRWLNSTVVRSRLEKTVRNRLLVLLQVPLKNLLAGEAGEAAGRIGDRLGSQLVAALQDEAVVQQVAAALGDWAGRRTEQGTLGELLQSLLGPEALARGEEQLVAAIMKMFNSEEMQTALGGMVDGLLAALREKPMGRLGRFIPPMVVGSIAEAVQGGVTKVMAAEIPGLVETLGIRRIVTEKINSLDLLRLEKLLLSIMEEQFKYINLFGALLGFVIGCLNLLFISL